MKTQGKVVFAVVGIALTVFGMVMFAVGQGTGGMMGQGASGMMEAQNQTGTQTPVGPACSTANARCTQGGVCMERCTGGGNADDGGSYKCPGPDSKGTRPMGVTTGASACYGSQVGGTARRIAEMMTGRSSSGNAASCSRASI